jgi:hypothetical protein
VPVRPRPVAQCTATGIDLDSTRAKKRTTTAGVCTALSQSKVVMGDAGGGEDGWVVTAVASSSRSGSEGDALARSHLVQSPRAGRYSAGSRTLTLILVPRAGDSNQSPQRWSGKAQGLCFRIRRSADWLALASCQALESCMNRAGRPYALELECSVHDGVGCSVISLLLECFHEVDNGHEINRVNAIAKGVIGDLVGFNC